MKEVFREITDSEWERIAPLLPELRPDRPSRSGRAPIFSLRAVFNGILWAVCTGSAWRAIPPTYAPHTVCRTRFNGWYDSGTLYRAAAALSESMPELSDRFRSRKMPPRANARLWL